jgi:hypothetical protein
MYNIKFSPSGISQAQDLSTETYLELNLLNGIEPHIATDDHVEPSVPGPLAIMGQKYVDVLLPCAQATDKQASVVVAFPALAIQARPVGSTWAGQHCHHDAKCEAEGRQRKIDDADVLSWRKEGRNRMEDVGRREGRVGFCLVAVDGQLYIARENRPTHTIAALTARWLMWPLTPPESNVIICGIGEI